MILSGLQVSKISFHCLNNTFTYVTACSSLVDVFKIKSLFHDNLTVDATLPFPLFGLILRVSSRGYRVI